ncbi:cytochrome c biogenesis protein ResB [Nocardioides sp. GY 10113]|uniref:cytochrome c biogenesis protein ResB n=1 Tax=Nocardioides sp. GY 10113 TaxID=2569761 RepID=UPI0010A85B3D|nr:cytochrome c biogenesis protein ResB [Nocardioides sp. GY 10113]TIC89260.1 cytochrome c biogenesis protein ResB [Nocardioides sp. GY 10113]
MSTATTRPATTPDGGRGPERRSGELTARELGRWTWRQITSMRTALVLLLLLALAAVPGSVIPQSGVDALGVNRWQEEHPTLTPIYEKLDLFSVYDSVWFSAIYLLLVVSLVGCILPRTAVYFRAMRAQPPAAPKNLTRLPEHATFSTDEEPEAVLARARAVLGRRYRLRSVVSEDPVDFVAGERGYLREAGNLLFHLSVLIVLAGFAIGGLFGYQGGVIVVQGGTFTNNLTQYDDFNPGALFRTGQLDDFCFDVDSYDDTWLTEGPRAGMAIKFHAGLTYQEHCGSSAEQTYDLRVNHPLSVGSTDVFLIGHGYAPVVTVRDGEGDIAYTGPTVFLPQDSSFLSFGVIKAPAAKPEQIGLEGLFYPSFDMVDGNPVTVFGDDLNPTLSMLAYRGDLGLDDGAAQSVYVLDTSDAELVTKDDGKPFRVDLQPGDTRELPDGLGSVTFEGVEPWVRVQISQTPGKLVALAGVVLALIGLCGSLFIRPRRVWVRARRAEGSAGSTMVEVAVLDRSGNADVSEVLDGLVERLDVATSSAEKQNAENQKKGAS